MRPAGVSVAKECDKQTDSWDQQKGLPEEASTDRHKKSPERYGITEWKENGRPSWLVQSGRST